MTPHRASPLLTVVSTIFISYRRDDAAPYAGRLHDHLGAHFGPQKVFIDIGTIDPGEDFTDAISKTVERCEVLVVLIGPKWLTLTERDGRRRLDNAADLVRMEISAALRRGIRVIPALVGDATMPTAEDLPEDLKKLANRNAIEISDLRFCSDVDRLIQAIEKVRAAKTAADRPDREPEAEAPFRIVDRRMPAAPDVAPDNVIAQNVGIGETAVAVPERSRGRRFVTLLVEVTLFVAAIIAISLVTNYFTHKQDIDRSSTPQRDMKTVLQQPAKTESVVNRGDDWRSVLTPQRVTAEVRDENAFRSLLGDHLLGLQWIGWDNYFVKVHVIDRNGVISMKGETRSRTNSDYLTVDGVVTSVDTKEFAFDGTITTSVSYINDGKPCTRTGAMTFKMTGARRYWRLQQMANPCSTATDYVDIFLRP